jgi:hypothetical protein
MALVFSFLFLNHSKIFKRTTLPLSKGTKSILFVSHVWSWKSFWHAVWVEEVYDTILPQYPLLAIHTSPADHARLGWMRVIFAAPVPPPPPPPANGTALLLGCRCKIRAKNAPNIISALLTKHRGKKKKWLIRTKIKFRRCEKRNINFLFILPWMARKVAACTLCIALYFGAGFRVLLLGVKCRSCDG